MTYKKYTHCFTLYINKLKLKLALFRMMFQCLNICCILLLVCEPVKVVPIAFTVYLDGDLIFLPIKLSDLFACSNNGHIDDESCLLFEVKIYSYRQLLQKLILKYDDYICNLLDKLHLTIGKRYRVHAKVVSAFNQLEQWKTPGCNVLIVTGRYTTN